MESRATRRGGSDLASTAAAFAAMRTALPTRVVTACAVAARTRTDVLTTRTVLAGVLSLRTRCLGAPGLRAARTAAAVLALPRAVGTAALQRLAAALLHAHAHRCAEPLAHRLAQHRSARTTRSHLRAAALDAMATWRHLAGSATPSCAGARLLRVLLLARAALRLPLLCALLEMLLGRLQTLLELLQPFHQLLRVGSLTLGGALALLRGGNGEEQGQHEQELLHVDHQASLGMAHGYGPRDGVPTAFRPRRAQLP